MSACRTSNAPTSGAAAHRCREGGRPILLVCSSGGHLLQMLALRASWEPFERVWVTFDKSDARALLGGERVVHAHCPTNRSIPNLLRNLRLARRVVGDLHPAAVVTTGAGVAVPFALMARLRSIPVTYVESFTRIQELSLSARMIRPAASRFYVQWPELATKLPEARYVGSLFDAR